MIIYKTTNRVNGKIYIGYDTKNDSRYYGSGIKYLLAEKKYGKENFIKSHIDFSDDFNELCLKEQFWIRFYNSQDDDIGYNIADGGLGNKGWVQSKETKLKRANSNKGKTPWNKNKIGLCSEETRRKMRENHADVSGKNNPFYGNHSLAGENHPMYGKHHSEESKMKNSVSQIGNKNAFGCTRTEEYKQKQRVIQSGKKHPAHSIRMTGENNPMSRTNRAKRKLQMGATL